MVEIVSFSVGFSIILLLISSLTVAHAQSSDVFEDELISHPLKIVVSLDYTEKQFRDGVGHSIWLPDSHHSNVVKSEGEI